MINDFINLIFPVSCCGCSQILIKGEHLVCSNCMLNLPVTDFHLNFENELQKRFWGKIPINYALSYLKFSKGGMVQHFLHHLKYKGITELGELLGKWYAHTLLKSGFQDKFDMIIPVPLHPSKLKKRGYNQSDFFGKGLSDGLKIPLCTNIVKRVIANPTQTKKGRGDRWENVKNIFAADPKINIRGLKILLIDDVLTTGSTLEASALSLLDKKVSEISIATIACA